MIQLHQEWTGRREIRWLSRLQHEKKEKEAEERIRKKQSVEAIFQQLRRIVSFREEGGK